MKINIEKTKIMVFRNGGILKHTEKKLYLNNRLVEVLSFYKYLGLFFTPKLIWTKTHELLALQGIRHPHVYVDIKETLAIYTLRIFSNS